MGWIHISAHVHISYSAPRDLSGLVDKCTSQFYTTQRRASAKQVHLPSGSEFIHLSRRKTFSVALNRYCTLELQMQVPNTGSLDNSSTVITM